MKRPHDVANTPAPPTPARTLTQLAHDAGPDQPTLLADLLEGATTAELIAHGARLASARIVTDTRRLYTEAWDFWKNATAAQQTTLRGVSRELLSVAIHQALHLEQLAGRHDDKVHTEHAVRWSRDAGASAATSAGLVVRDRAQTVLLSVAGHDATLRARVDAAVGTSTTAEDLALGLERLAAIAREFAHARKGPVANRARLARLDADYVATLDAAAASVRADASAQAPAPGAKTSQAELDRNDGINLLLLGHVVHSFQSAHDIDPSIPRLVPSATSRLLGRHTHGTPSAAPSPPAASPSPAT